jgi:hypothetical protein
LNARHFPSVLVLALLPGLAACTKPEPIKLRPVAAAARPPRPVRSAQAQAKPALGTAPSCGLSSVDTAPAADTEKERLFRAFTDEETAGAVRSGPEPASAPCPEPQR